jgi:hypothetical protein
VDTAKCGNSTVQYDGTVCSYSCECIKNNGCFWSVTCGQITVSGTGLVRHPHSGTSVTVAGGNLAMCAKNLQGLWDRRVIVPPKLRTQRVRKRTLKGTPEEVAEALGLRLGPKRKRRSKTRAK